MTKPVWHETKAERDIEREREREREKRESRVGFNKLQVEFGVNLKVCHSP